MKQKHLGISALLGKIYYGSTSKDGSWWQDKVEIPKSEFIKAILDWVESESEGSNIVGVTKDVDGEKIPFAEIKITYYDNQGVKND